MLKPDLFYQRVTQITPSALRVMQIRALLLDVDNTLARHGVPEPSPGTLEWAALMIESGFRLMILSNNTKARVAPFAAQYQLPFLSMACKPMPFGFLQASRMLDVSPRACAVIGDQLFTDILGAKLSGMRSVLLEPIQEEEAGLLALKRRLERPYRKKYMKNRSDKEP